VFSVALLEGLHIRCSNCKRTRQNRTIFVISELFLDQGMRKLLYFYERSASFEKSWESMP